MLPGAEAVVPCITESNSLFKRSFFGDNKDKIQFVQKLYKEGECEKLQAVRPDLHFIKKIFKCGFVTT